VKGFAFEAVSDCVHFISSHVILSTDWKKSLSEMTCVEWSRL